MPRRKVALELSPEDEQPARGRTKLVNAKHKIEYEEPIVVPTDTPSADEDMLEDDLGEIEDKPKRKTKNEREELRKKLMAGGVTPASSLKLLVQKYVHSDAADSGTLAEKSYCTKYPCSEAHITTQDYMEIVSSKWGAGRYWFTLYMNNKIVTQWEESLAAKTQPLGSIVQHAIPGDPTSPQVIVQMPEGSHQTVTPIDPFKEAERALNLVKKYNEAFGTFHPAQGAANPARSEEEILASAILKQPEVIENVVGSVIKRFGNSGGGSDEPWYAEAVKDAVKSGQAVQIVKAGIDAIFNGISSLFPKREVNNNGQAAMGAPSLAHQGQNETRTAQGQNDQPEISGRPAEVTEAHAPLLQSGATQSPTAPEEQALQLVIDHCQKKIPPEVTCETLLDTAEAWLDQGYSINGWIRYFVNMPTDAALEFVKTLPNGEAVVSMEHTKAWTEQLQKLIRESQEGAE